MGIEPISLDLRIGNQSRLIRMSQHHLFHLLKLFQLVVDQAPVPARFHHCFARTIQPGKESSKTTRRVCFHSPLPQLAPCLIQRAQHAVLLVNVYSYVIHENSFLSFSSLRTEELLSFYLTHCPPKAFASRQAGDGRCVYYSAICKTSRAIESKFSNSPGVTTLTV